MGKKIVWIICCVSFFGFSQNKEERLDAYFQKGSSFLYANKDSLNYYFGKSIKLCDELNDINSKIMILFYYVEANGYYYDLKQLKYNLDRIDSIIKNNETSELIDNVSDVHKNFLIHKGNYNFKIKNYPVAAEIFQRLADILSLVPSGEMAIADRTILFSTYNYLASIHQLTNKNDLAKNYYQKSFRLENEGPIQHADYRIHGTKTRLAKVYESEKEYTKANELLREALSYYSSGVEKPRLKNNLLTTYQRLAKNYLLQDSISQAISTLKESEQYYIPNDAFERSAQLVYGDIYQQDKKYEKAREYYEGYLTKTKAYRINQKHPDLAEAYARLGTLYNEKGNFAESLKYYQQGLAQLAPGVDEHDFTKNPNPEEVSSKLELVKLLKQKLGTLYQIYEKKKDTKYLTTALKTSYCMIKTLDVLKPEFESKVDKQFLISDTYPAFHSMMEVAYELYSQTKDQKYIQDAFHFMEKSKSILLLEASRSSQANAFGDIPKELLNEEQHYRATIIHLEKQIFNEGKQPSVVDSLFHLKNRYYDFIGSIEHNFPKYYDLKYNNEVVSLSGVQELLDKETGLISYFVSENDLFIIAVKKGTTVFYKTPIDQALKDEMRRFHMEISDVNTETNQIYDLGQKIYKKILDQPLRDIQVKKLVVLPDDLLNYVPFEVLSKNPDSPEYLINEYQISYANSATLLQEQRKMVDTEKNMLLAFAPSFGKTNDPGVAERSDFGPLLYNREEVENITTYFKGKKVVGEEATTDFFRGNSKTHNMLHFATHAATNDRNPDYSYLAFAQNENGVPDLLYVKDLYAYTIDASLVTLSACQTGVGTLQRGEGMLSLARGFSYAGARSLVTTLWKVNDQTTAELMHDFYKNLSSNISKDQALREAKLKYLNSTEDDLMLHPYYWSGFMISGDMSPIGNQTSKLWWLILLVPVGIILMFFSIKPVNLMR